MELLVIRHGTAQGHGGVTGDGGRALTEKGRRQAGKAGAFLEEEGLVPDLILSSPLERARETAGIVAESAGADAPVLQEWLSCGMAPEDAMRELGVYAEACHRVAIVGHEPDLSALISHVLGVTDGRVRVRKGAVILLRIDPPRSGGVLEFNLWTRMLAER